MSLKTDILKGIQALLDEPAEKVLDDLWNGLDAVRSVVNDAVELSEQDDAEIEPSPDIDVENDPKFACLIELLREKSVWEPAETPVEKEEAPEVDPNSPEGYRQRIVAFFKYGGSEFSRNYHESWDYPEGHEYYDSLPKTFEEVFKENWEWFRDEVMEWEKSQGIEYPEPEPIDPESAEGRRLRMVAMFDAEDEPYSSKYNEPVDSPEGLTADVVNRLWNTAFGEDVKEFEARN